MVASWVRCGWPQWAHRRDVRLKVLVVGVGEEKLTDATRGGLRRPLTIIALIAAGLALVMTPAVLLAAFGVLPPSLVGTFVAIWVICLAVVFGVTRYLKSPRPGEEEPPPV